MAVHAAQGSILGRFERVHSGSITWQFVVGREAAIYWSAERYLKMTELELPVVDIRTQHLFSGRLGADVSLELGAELEWVTIQADDEPSRNAITGSAFARLGFDGLFYAYP